MFSPSGELTTTIWLSSVINFAASSFTSSNEIPSTNLLNKLYSSSTLKMGEPFRKLPTYTEVYLLDSLFSRSAKYFCIDLPMFFFCLSSSVDVNPYSLILFASSKSELSPLSIPFSSTIADKEYADLFRTKLVLPEYAFTNGGSGDRLNSASLSLNIL